MRVGDLVDDRFMLEKKAGAGGMGVVFRAFDKSSGMPVALKAVLGAEQEFDRFEREVAALIRIQHPRVVRYIAHGGNGDDRYMAMEWLEGHDLAERLAQGKPDLDATLQLVRGIAEALAALHAAEIVHRDIKPSNVFLPYGDVEQVKLLDLGIARTHDVGWTLTATGSLLGTPAYMAPEQARGESVDARADLFALGCIFYECLVGQSPFAAAHPVASLARILVEETPRIRDTGIKVPPGVEVLVESLLVKERDGRLKSATEVLDMLDRLDNLHPASPPEIRTSLTLGEQRIVSVVLTRTGHHSDATEHAMGTGSITEHVKHLADLHSARLEQLPNGSFIAIFTCTTSPRDHAANAAAFALGLSDLWNEPAIALTTGRGEMSGRLPVGAVIERAVASLRSNRKGIFVDSVSAALLEGRYRFAIDGDEHQLLGPADKREIRRTVAGQTSMFVGREREVASITSALRSCLDELVATIVLVTAPAGTGKSRLIDEVLQSEVLADGIGLMFVGACDMMNAGARHGVLARAVRPDPRDESLDRPSRRFWLAERIRSRVQSPDVDRIVELVAESCGLLDDQEISPALQALRDNPLLLADAIAEAWCAWMDAETSREAVVFVLEDLHWGDRPTVNLLERILRVLPERPIFILATARPEVHELFPRLWLDRGMQEIRLGRIAARSAERLAKRLLGARASDDVLRQIVERSGGHPFLLEELIRATLADPSKFDEIPETVLGMLQARFFTQSERARAALRAASIFGTTFWRQSVEHLLGDVDLEQEFEALGNAEFIERSRTSKFAETVEYAFRHALVRDAAHAMLTDTDRQTGHLLAGKWLESAGEREALVLAEHFGRGNALDRAAYWYHRAAEDALEGSDLAKATTWASRAIACGRQGHDLALSELILADAAFGRSDVTAAYKHANAAREHLVAGTDLWFSATSLCIASLGQQALNEDVLQELEKVVAVATDPPTDAQLICIARGIGQYVWVSRERMEPFHEKLLALVARTKPGPLARGWLARVHSEMLPHRWYSAAETARYCALASEEYEAAGAKRDAMMTRIFQVIQLAYMDRTAEALEIVQRCIVDVEKRGLIYLGYFAKLAQAIALFFDYQDQACLTLIEPHVSKFRSSVRLFCTGHTLVALTALTAGDLEKADISSQAPLTLEHVSDSGRFSIYGLRAYVLLALGRIDEAIACGEKAFDYFTPGFMDAFGELTYLGLAEAYLARSDRERARKVVAEFWDIFLGMPLDHANYPRRRVFRRLAELAEMFELPGTTKSTN